MEIVEKQPVFLCKILFSVECCCERHNLKVKTLYFFGLYCTSKPSKFAFVSYYPIFFSRVPLEGLLRSHG
jgi:hypothetical protein